MTWLCLIAILCAWMPLDVMALDTSTFPSGAFKDEVWPSYVSNRTGVSLDVDVRKMANEHAAVAARRIVSYNHGSNYATLTSAVTNGSNYRASRSALVSLKLWYKYMLEAGSFIVPTNSAGYLAYCAGADTNAVWELGLNDLTTTVSYTRFNICGVQEACAITRSATNILTYTPYRGLNCAGLHTTDTAYVEFWGHGHGETNAYTAAGGTYFPASYTSGVPVASGISNWYTTNYGYEALRRFVSPLYVVPINRDATYYAEWLNMAYTNYHKSVEQQGVDFYITGPPQDVDNQNAAYSNAIRLTREEYVADSNVFSEFQVTDGSFITHWTMEPSGTSQWDANATINRQAGSYSARITTHTNGMRVYSFDRVDPIPSEAYNQGLTNYVFSDPESRHSLGFFESTNFYWQPDITYGTNRLNEIVTTNAWRVGANAFYSTNGPEFRAFSTTTNETMFLGYYITPSNNETIGSIDLKYALTNIYPVAPTGTWSP